MTSMSAIGAVGTYASDKRGTINDQWYSSNSANELPVYSERHLVAIAKGRWYQLIFGTM